MYAPSAAPAALPPADPTKPIFVQRNAAGELVYLQPWTPSVPAAPSPTPVPFAVQEGRLEAPSPARTAKIEQVTAISFLVNGEEHRVAELDPRTTLNDYLRSSFGLSGTKKMCGEGGCGACTVMLSWQDSTGATVNIPINSCLAPLASVTGKSVTTVEGIGSWKEGYSAIQQQLADSNGSQCGFCSPGWVMSMHSLLTNNPNPTKKAIEDHFDGNLCRCTGYRPILDAFKSFASDYDPSESAVKRKGVFATDIEDLAAEGKQCGGKCGSKCKKLRTGEVAELSPCEKKAEQKRKKLIKKMEKTENYLAATAACTKERSLTSSAQLVQLDTSGAQRLWFHVYNLSDLYSLIQTYQSSVRKIVVGNTSIGIYKDTANAGVFLYIRDVVELNTVSLTATGLTVGASVTISSLIQSMQQVYDDNSGSYAVSTFPTIIHHLARVANAQVRSAACWAGNIALAHNRANFPSDIYTIMLGAGATVVVGDSATGATATYDLISLLSVDLDTSVILSIQIPFATSSSQHLESYKTALRHVNAHAFVNAAFNVDVDPSTYQITGSPTLAFGGIDRHAMRATQTETMLVGCYLTDSTTISNACATLAGEINPDPEPGKVEYRKSLATSYLYKFLLSLTPNVSSAVESAATPFYRPLSTGSLSYSTDPLEYPVSAYMPKLDSILQTSGEAKYTDDMPEIPGTLHAAFVLSPTANASLDSVDATAALEMPGVFDLVTADDIMGENNCDMNPGIPIQYHEHVFAESSVEYCGQSVGLILADTRLHAEDAAKAVAVTCSNEKEPILSIEQALEAGSIFPDTITQGVAEYTQGDVSTGLANSDVTFSGSIKAPMQYHFHMETHSCVVVPEENGKLLIHIGTQWPYLVQKVVARVLGWPEAKVHVGMKRAERINSGLGGGYGAKIARSCIVAAAAAVAAVKHNRPVRLVMSLNTNMELQGKRHEYLCEYEAGVNSDGKFQAVQFTLYSNGGATYDGTFGAMNMAMTTTDNAYYFPNFSTKGVCCRTNLPTNTYMRAPGCAPAIFFVEHVMERASQLLGMDPDTVRQTNFYQQGQVTPYGTPIINWTIPTLWSQLEQSSDYQARKSAVESYNAANRWTKRGISFVPIKYGITWGGAHYGVMISILADGTVQLTTSGCEIGQGLTTKVAQVCALELGVDIKYIQVLDNNTNKMPNSGDTGGSITSGLCSEAVVQCCAQLKQQMGEAMRTLPDMSWAASCNLAIALGTDLTARYWVVGKGSPEGPFRYNTYGVAVTEVHLDVLTGSVEVLRADILYDCGKSLNPAVDLGQCEGAFITGLGMFLSEKLEFDPNGKLTTNGTWEYKPPSAKDIPIDFRAGLLPNSSNPAGILSSKASGEPPLCLSCSAYFAVKHAIDSARSDAGADYLPALSPPVTVNVTQTACAVDYTQFSS